MSSTQSAMRFEDLSIKAAPRKHSKPDCFFYGYVRGKLVVPGALPDGSDLVLGVKDIEIKLVNGNPRVDFKGIPYQKDGVTKYSPPVIPLSKETRDHLTTLLFADPAVDAVVIAATDSFDAAEKAEGCAS